MRCIPYRTLSNRIEGVVMTFVDVSARKAAELELKSLNQELEERVAERVGTLRLLQAITVSANEATAVEEVLRSALARTCEYMRWPVGHAYLVDPSGKKLFSSGLWHAADTEKHALFRKAIEGLDLGAGEGLPGEVLATRRSLWLADISHRSTIQKNHPANQAGLKSTLLVPVLMQKDVVAVLEFFAPESREPNSRWLEVTEQIGMQVGRVFERKHAEARLKENERLAAIGTATAKMAHEINNPLSNIYAGVQFLEQELLEKKETGDTLNMMTDVRKEVDRLTRLMGDLRTFLVTGRQHLNLEPVDVSALAVEILRLEGLALGQRSIRLLQEIRANLPRVQGDPNKLKEVLVNLTRNSMDAMPEGGTLTVRTYQEGNHICLEVTDTGEGIAESLHPLEQPVTTKRQGIGLGLLIVRQIIADHGGTVTYTTRPGHGTTFRVTLPLAV
jgi:signal transduction histidine kinase